MVQEEVLAKKKIHEDRAYLQVHLSGDIGTISFVSQFFNNSDNVWKYLSLSSDSEPSDKD